MSHSPHVTVVTPTYNEKESLAELIHRICELPIENLDIIVVDDNSPDGTGALADELATKFPLRVIHRSQKEGLGKAYGDVFSELAARPAHMRPDFIIQMDADLSHNPSDIPRFLERVHTCDVVLGSRYMIGGGIENWGVIRRCISRFGNIYASVVLGLPYRDLTSGYKCFCAEVLGAIDFAAINSIGYNFQIETTHAAHKKRFRICEIPIMFTERKFGASKFNIGIILESFWKVLMLRFGKRPK
ncbi:MAG: dolichol-phosphate mannosyltransferase [Parcubacteria group bacterium Gr01-1014_70]|nr:MAG: dolichol-phosphate mannosyltransferase [Parcubacteria group bacterium Gr01-1014_70]